MCNIDINELIKKVDSCKNDSQAVAKKAFEDFIIKFIEDESLKNGILSMASLDESEKIEFLRLSEQFDKEFSYVLRQSYFLSNCKKNKENA